MCRYCNCIKEVQSGKIGERIGGRANAVFIMKFSDNLFNTPYWIVERKDGTVDRVDASYHRLVEISFCPVCGNRLY